MCIRDREETYNVAGKKWTPVALATEILKGLKNEIKRKNVDAKSVVMAVPVGFSPKKRMKLREDVYKRQVQPAFQLIF